MIRGHSFRVDDAVWDAAVERANFDDTSIDAIIVDALEQYGGVSTPIIDDTVHVSDLDHRLLTASEVADELGVGTVTIRRYVAAGVLPCTWVGTGRGAMRFTRRWVDEFKAVRA